MFIKWHLIIGKLMTQNPRKAKPGSLEYQKTVDQIIWIAAELIEEVGYKGLKFDELAARLECNRATIYRYFDSKQELLESVMLMLMTEVTQDILERTAGTKKVTKKSFAESLYQVIETLGEEARYAIIMMPENVRLFSELAQSHYGELAEEMLHKHLDSPSQKTPIREGVNWAHIVPWLMHQIVSYSFLGVPGESVKAKKDYLERMVAAVIID